MEVNFFPCLELYFPLVVVAGPSLKLMSGVDGGGTNPCDAGLDLSGSWQQGHSATYNAPSRI